MKISKREKNLLLGVSAIVIGVVYYFFVFTVQSEKLLVKETERTTLQNDYDAKTTRINNLKANRTKNEQLYKELLDKTFTYYPTIIQAKIIIEIDKFMKENGVKGDLSFEESVVQPVEKIGAPYLNESNGKLEEITNSIDEKTKEATYSQPETGKSSVESEQLKVSLKFKDTTYEQLKKFIIALEAYEKKIAINGLDAVAKVGKLNGSITLEFYGIAKLNGEADEYLKWTIENIYGKEELFSNGSATGAYNSSIEQQASNESVNDFAMILRAPSSESPLLTMGKTKDESRQSYINSDNTNFEDVIVEFQEENGKLYYKYKTSEDSFPKADNGLGEVFTPVSGNIVFEILSERRLGDSDSSGVNLKIINNTSKTVSVVVRNDDETKPRVKVISEGNTATSVTKK